MKTRITLFYLFTLSTLLLPSEVFSREYIPTDFYQFFGNPKIQENFFPKKRISYQDIKTWPFDSYESFLEQLNEKRPQFFQNEVLIHTSSSLQPSSLKSPRILLFGDGLVMAFNEIQGSESKSHRVEVIEFDRDKAQFIPREILFNRLKKKGVQFNDQPTSCLACHGEPFRPIWNPYDFWSRAFGSRIGRIGSDQEEKAYHQYFASSQKGIRKYLKKDAIPEGDHLMLRSIEAFTGYMNTLNSITMGKLLASKNLDALEYPLLWILNYCASNENNQDSTRGDQAFLSLFSDDFHAQAPLSFEALQKETQLARNWFKTYSDRIYAEVFPNIQKEYFFIDHNRLRDEAFTVTRLRYLLENKGISLRNLVLSHGANDYFFSTPNNFIADLKNTYEHYLNQSASEELKNATSYSCQQLEDISRSLNQDFNSEASRTHIQQSRFDRPQKDLSPMGKCMKCHTLDYNQPKTKGPYIPFDDSAKMQKLLKTTGLGEEIKYRISTEDSFDQMPPKARLSSEEISALNEYVDTLKE